MTKTKVLTIGWKPEFIDKLLREIGNLSEIDFTHGLVGNNSHIGTVKKNYPSMKFVSLSKSNRDPLPEPDYEYLAILEDVGYPTIRCLIRGDRVLRYRKDQESFGYATLLAKNTRKVIEELEPDIVLASFDSVHSGISLLVSKSCNIPWVALSFSTIPEGLTAFCKSMDPDSIVPIERELTQEVLKSARKTLDQVRASTQDVMGYRAPISFSQYAIQYAANIQNLYKRIARARTLGADRYTYSSIVERSMDLLRRLTNRVMLPTRCMVSAIPASKFVYFPLHMAPESSVDSWAPFYQNQLALVEQVALALPADLAFVVKLHFSDPDNYSRAQLKKLMCLPNIHIANPNSPSSVFIENASLVIGIQGTSCIEAALLAKPVLIFGDSPYLRFPGAEKAGKPDQIYQQISRMLTNPRPTEDEILKAFINYMLRYLPGRINDWTRPIKNEDIQILAAAFCQLRDFVGIYNNRINWYE